MRPKQERGNSHRAVDIVSTGGSTLSNRESVRRRYRPKRVRILFVGEAPPASGRFFYHGDSGLYRAIRDTFLAAFPSLPKDDFLRSFQSSGCYLVDVCGEPVDHLPRSTRLMVCRAGEGRLARKIRTLRPEVIVTLVMSIRASVQRAQKMAIWAGLHVELPYPGRWKRHRVEFQRRLEPVLLKILGQHSQKAATEARG